jgi:serine/threonine-protein kinase haspin
VYGGLKLARCVVCLMQLNTMSEAKSIIKQVTLSLAVAERELHFEHRDLHWGNVLVSQTNLRVLEYAIDGRTMSVETCGVKVAVIDFTLSRLTKGTLFTFFMRFKRTIKHHLNLIRL